MTTGATPPDIAACLTLIAVRHGSTALTGEVLNGSGPGAADPDLNELGRRQSEALRRRLTTEVCGFDDLRWTFASTARRAVATAEVLVGEWVPTDLRLCEVDFGAWEGRRPGEVHRAEPDRFTRWLTDPSTPAPEGTSLVQAAQRVRAFRAHLLSQLGVREHARALVVAHASTVRILVADALGLELSQSARLTVTPATAAVVNFWADGGSSLEALLPGWA